jgi:transcriptional regulator GlxA family with amidase domain
MQRSQQLFEATEQEALYVARISTAIGVTDRTGVSPYRYLWLRRTNRVRGTVVMAEPTAKTVTQNANDCGFGELGRFAATYCKPFWESPSATLDWPPDNPGRRIV